MRSLRKVLIVVTACGTVALLSGVSSAEMGAGARKDHHQAQIKLLQDSAAALQTSNPELGTKLSAWAADEMNEKEDKGHEEMEGKTEKKSNEDHQSRLKLLRDSAIALQTSHPDLATGLTNQANRMEKRMKKDAREDSKERGERKE